MTDVALDPVAVADEKPVEAVDKVAEVVARLQGVDDEAAQVIEDLAAQVRALTPPEPILPKPERDLRGRIEDALRALPRPVTLDAAVKCARDTIGNTPDFVNFQKWATTNQGQLLGMLNGRR